MSKTAALLTAALALTATTSATHDYAKPLFSYSTVTGYFLQDDASTNPSTFDYTATNFGLKNRSYSPEIDLPFLTQWQRFDLLVEKLAAEAGPSAQLKLLFLGRHGQGFHNAAESYYGTPAWNCFYAEEDGNATTQWADALLTGPGVSQARVAHDFWAHEIKDQRIRTPDSYFSSPLSRCLQTANDTFADLALPPYAPPFKPTVKELLREGISIHTCDRRGSASYIRRAFPGFALEPGFAQDDPLWSGVVAETPSSQDARSQAALDQLFSDPRSGRVVSVTSHSGEIASILRVLGHRAFSLNTGAVIPVLVRADVKPPPSTSTVPWTPSPHCTVPPVTSISNGACVCPGGATPVTTTLAGATPVHTA